MAKVKYQDWNPQKKTMVMLEKLAEVIEDYKQRGFYPLSLRQIYYQAVARGFIPNSDNSYHSMTYNIKKAREAGIFDWDDVEDRNRFLRTQPHWNDPTEIIQSAAAQYARDSRSTQPNYIECWIEKDALIGVLEPVARKYDVPCFACKGFVSATANHETAARFKAQAHRERRIIIYAGDYDPSGFGINTSIVDKQALYGNKVELIRIGLSKEQIRKYNPPPAPVKMKDTRSTKFIETHGTQVWELDALDPQIIADLYAEQIEALTDFDLVHEEKRREAVEKSMLYSVYQNWHRVVANL